MKKFVITDDYEKRRQVGNHSWHFQRYEYCCQDIRWYSKRQGYCQVCSGGKVMFLLIENGKIIAEEECLGNALNTRWC